MKKLLVIMIASLGFLLTACVPDISGDSNTITDSYNTTTNTDSFNEYTSEQEDIISGGYIPDVDGVCDDGYFWCSVESKCLPALSGVACPVDHTEEEEAEADELNTPKR